MDREMLFAIYFSQIAGWQYHPGSGHGEHKILSLAQAAEEADKMLAIHSLYFPESED